MRKAFTASAVAVVTAAALAGPVAAFADAPSPSPAVTVSSQQGDDQQDGQSQQGQQGFASDKAQVSVQLSSPGDPAGFHAGETVSLTAKTSGNALGGVIAKSPAFGSTHLAPTDASGTTWTGTAVISQNAGIGTLPVRVVANFGDTGAETSATVLVNTETTPAPDPSPSPTPQQTSLTLSTDGARPGDKVQVTIDSGDLRGDARIESGAFGGTVDLSPEPGSSGWHGTATVAANARPGYYRVDGYVGSQKIDSVKFGIADTVTGHRQAHKNQHQHQSKHHAVTPIRVDGRTVPRGAVNAGASGAPDTGPDAGLLAGAAGLSAAVLLGGTVLWRRRHHS
ncbi:LPXTG cell wall anchor domain-containing protein [Streptomyces sp. NBC_00237]|uniref:LPXTG cell wall anchor domain-containing protein n=1 Tax=Streptomyces sp. NBC_00237 TaxID=2975687 RepID=UPI002253DE97|nr:LPXTG cell wall anchor domain-containing protein [Streptomyces sp. NBC_00237]MCX5205395.1 LPXTG cell wall anchor domain-containing protein [Streptomyces sp. NBC_00237]